MEESTLLSRITEKFPDAIVDISGEDCSFELYIITKSFEGLRSLQRQQAILALFKPELTTGKLHALSLICKTPEEQAKAQGEGLVHLTL